MTGKASATPRSFAPVMPAIPIIGVGFSIWLIVELRDWFIYAQFAVWFVVGLIIYLSDTRRHSRLARFQRAQSDDRES